MLTSACRLTCGKISRRGPLFKMTTRGMGTPKLGERDATYAWNKSCYSGIDYTIGDECTVFEAVEKFAAFNVGCLVTKDANGNLSGVVSERDYVKKIALLGKKSKEVLVKQISTKAADLITVSPNDTVDACMQKMLSRDIRHLPLVDDEGNVVGIVSIKDLIKTCLEEKEHTIEQLASFAVGEGGHFVM
ncbi:hypothetical protein ACHAW6_001316 [Cyclotella cf. meneghiniana]